MPTPSDVTHSHIERNDDRNRYELSVDGKLAVSKYNRLTKAVMFTHTEVPEALEGQGVGSALARGALDDVRVQGLTVIPLCPFIAAFIRRHPEYLDLVSAVSRSQVERKA